MKPATPFCKNLAGALQSRPAELDCFPTRSIILSYVSVWRPGVHYVLLFDHGIQLVWYVSCSRFQGGGDDLKYRNDALELVRPERNTLTISFTDVEQHNQHLATTILEEYYRWLGWCFFLNVYYETFNKMHIYTYCHECYWSHTDDF